MSAGSSDPGSPDVGGRQGGSSRTVETPRSPAERQRLHVHDSPRPAAGLPKIVYVRIKDGKISRVQERDIIYSGMMTAGEWRELVESIEQELRSASSSNTRNLFCSLLCMLVISRALFVLIQSSLDGSREIQLFMVVISIACIVLVVQACSTMTLRKAVASRMRRILRRHADRHGDNVSIHLVPIQTMLSAITVDYYLIISPFGMRAASMPGLDASSGLASMSSQNYMSMSATRFGSGGPLVAHGVVAVASTVPQAAEVVAVPEIDDTGDRGDVESPHAREKTPRYRLEQLESCREFLTDDEYAQKRKDILDSM